jgi:phosphoenolpyruvate synthase/pyruvate phosphate dikinase
MEEKENNWLVYTRGKVRLYDFDMAIRSTHECSNEFFPNSSVCTFFAYEKNKIWFAWGKKELKRAGKSILEKISVNSKKEKHFQDMKFFASKAMKAAEKIRKTELAVLTDEGIENLYKYIYKESKQCFALMNYEIDIIDVVLEDFLVKKFKKELSDKLKGEQFSVVYNKMITPVYKTFVSEQEEAILKAGLKKGTIDQEVKKIYNKFWWTSLSWEGMFAHSEEYFRKRVIKSSKNKKAKEELHHIENMMDQSRQNRKDIIKNYSLSKDAQYWLVVADEYVYFHDLRKEVQVKVLFAAYLLMKEVARRLKINPADLEWLFHKEVMGLLSGNKIDSVELKRRKKSHWTYFDTKKIDFLSGDSAIEKRKFEIIENNKMVASFEGTSVSHGIISARAKVCTGVVEATRKIKSGDVLVCAMTTPDWVPYMKKASAIVTDEGGVTCHAAIISRELKKPCIVGTKIATSVLKDGDLVEVNADKGIVKIIK